MSIEKMNDKELELWYNNLTQAEQWGAFFKWADDVKKRARLKPYFEKTIGGKNAGRILMDLSADSYARELARRRKDFLMDYKSSMSAARRIGMQQGLEQGIEQGMKKQKDKDQKILAQKDAEIARMQKRIAELESGRQL